MLRARDLVRSDNETNRNFEICAIDLPPSEPLTEAMLRALADPRDPLVAISMREVVSRDACQRAMDTLNRLNGTHYGGMAGDTISVGLGGSAWEVRYVDHDGDPANSVENWNRYFDAVAEWDRQREDLLGDIFGVDPLDLPINILSTALGRQVERAVHPRFGRRMGAGLIRRGVPLRHFDWGPLDVGFDADGHIGLVLVFQGAESAVQRVWEQQATPDGRGNYDLPAVGSYIDSPAPMGSLCLLSARYTHAIVDSADRCTLAAHVAHLRNGDQWRIYA